MAVVEAAAAEAAPGRTGHGRDGVLQPSARAGTLHAVDDTEATQPILESLFDIRTEVRDLVSVLTEDDDDTGEEEES